MAKTEHYTIGDALVVLFENPLFYFVLAVAAIFIALGFGGCK